MPFTSDVPFRAISARWDAGVGEAWVLSLEASTPRLEARVPKLEAHVRGFPNVIPADAGIQSSSPAVGDQPRGRAHGFVDSALEWRGSLVVPRVTDWPPASAGVTPERANRRRRIERFRDSQAIPGNAACPAPP